MSPRLSPDDLLVFAIVAKTGNLTHAARHLAMDAATVGRRIGRLEQAVGATLFTKSPKGYQLADAGQTLLPQAEALETLMDGIGSDISEQSRRLTGRVRIGAPDGCATFLLPRVCAGMLAAHPGLTIDVVASSREMDLLGREVDLTITLNPPSAKTIEASHLADYQLLLATARSVVEGRDPAAALQDLPVVGYMPELLIDPTLDLPAGLGLRAPVLRSNSVLVQWQWLRDGAGVGLTHDFTLAADPTLIQLRPEFAIQRSYYLCSRREDARFERMRTLRSALIDQFTQTLGALQDRPIQE